MKDTHDIHFARCRACCKSLKLQTMGEAALTSHAGGAGHKAAVRKLVEGNINIARVGGEWVHGGLSAWKHWAAASFAGRDAAADLPSTAVLHICPIPGHTFPDRHIFLHDNSKHTV